MGVQMAGRPAHRFTAKPISGLNFAPLGIMSWGMLCVILSTVGLLSARNTSRPARASAADLVSDPRVQQALAKLTSDAGATTEEQVRITEIPAPPFHESERGDYLSKLFSRCRFESPNRRSGKCNRRARGRRQSRRCGHDCRAFGHGVPSRHQRARAARRGRFFAPGISDNGTGLAALVALARAMRDAKLETNCTILFVADVGEEGEGNLRGIRKLVETYRKQVRYVIALDGSATDYVTSAALASHRVEVTINGPGGHSWSDFGAPNPINALARGIARFVKTPVPDEPRTTFNVGEIEGGTSVNAIPASASIKVDLRSESDAELAKIETLFRDAMRAGVDEEMSSSRSRGVAAGKGLMIVTKVLGIRPGGELAANSPLLAAVQAADDSLGNRSRAERSSTDANIPLSLGIPAIAIGAGGRSGGAHTLDEWYDPAGRDLGLRRVLLTLLKVAELASPVSSLGN